ncbi:MAG TPA: dihydrolipoamide acetyltransferase family protein [Kiritimatiellia bacterium]|nr:dihydrolipoamide acetyltransferase family protein [Kiritimatiellia bacterium]
MSVPIVMPQMGQSVAEGVIVAWKKAVGEPVQPDEIVVEVESDKISFEIESPAGGILASCLKQEGETAKVGEVIGLISVPGEQDAVPAAASAPANRPHAAADGDQLLVSADRCPSGRLSSSELPALTREWFSPYLLRMAMLNNIGLQELQAIRGTGKGGRVTRNDFLTYLSQRAAKTHAPAAPAEPSPVPENVAALGQVIPMNSMRRTIADHMIQSIHTSAHVTMVHAVDMTRIVAFREQVKDRFFRQYGVKMTYTTVMIFVTARVLKDYPSINAYVFGSNIVLRNEVNIGCAVALQDESLVVPVIKDADKKSFPEIAQDLERLIGLARGKSLTRADVEGATFTISNFGAFGSIIGTPIINQPQVAILGMGAIFKAPVVIDNEIKIRDQVYLSFSFDHRVIDGAMGGRFLNALQKTAEALNMDDLSLAEL